MSQNGAGGCSSSSRNKPLPKNLEELVDSVFRQGKDKGAKVDADAEAWFKQLPPEQQTIVDEGIEAILKGGIGLAAERSFDTLVRQRKANENDKVARKEQQQRKNAKTESSSSTTGKSRKQESRENERKRKATLSDSMEMSRHSSGSLHPTGYDRRGDFPPHGGGHYSQNYPPYQQNLPSMPPPATYPAGPAGHAPPYGREYDDFYGRRDDRRRDFGPGGGRREYDERGRGYGGGGPHPPSLDDRRHVDDRYERRDSRSRSISQRERWYPREDEEHRRRPYPEEEVDRYRDRSYSERSRSRDRREREGRRRRSSSRRREEESSSRRRSRRSRDHSDDERYDADREMSSIRRSGVDDHLESDEYKKKKAATVEGECAMEDKVPSVVESEKSLTGGDSPKADGIIPPSSRSRKKDRRSDRRRHRSRRSSRSRSRSYSDEGRHHYHSSRRRRRRGDSSDDSRESSVGSSARHRRKHSDRHRSRRKHHRDRSPAGSYSNNNDDPDSISEKSHKRRKGRESSKKKRRKEREKERIKSTTAAATTEDSTRSPADAHPPEP